MFRNNIYNRTTYNDSMEYNELKMKAYLLSEEYNNLKIEIKNSTLSQSQKDAILYFLKTMCSN